jgi:hypothetical protein
MKQGLKTLIIMLLLSSEFSNPTAAQPDKPVFSEDKHDLPGKKDLGDKNYEVVMLEADFPKVAAGFSSLYPAAQSPLWIKEGKSLFVYFQNKGNKVSAVFSTEGNMNYSVTHLNASGLPERIKKNLRSVCSSCSVFNVKQIQTANDMIYEVVLESSSEYIIIHADEEEIVTTEKIRKSSY